MARVVEAFLVDLLAAFLEVPLVVLSAEAFLEVSLVDLLAASLADLHLVEWHQAVPCLADLLEAFLEAVRDQSYQAELLVDLSVPFQVAAFLLLLADPFLSEASLEVLCPASLVAPSQVEHLVALVLPLFPVEPSLAVQLVPVGPLESLEVLLVVVLSVVHLCSQ